MSEIYETMEERVSYGIGREMGEQLRANSIDGLSIEAVLAGLADALNGVESAVSHQDLHTAFAQMQERLQAEATEKSQALAAEGEKLRADGEAFLAENAKREGVQVTDSGLQYEVLKEGSGEKPTHSNTVRTHYHGTFIDGTVFDSSVERGAPAEFPVSGVISGWVEALQMMKTGSKWKLYVPYKLGYGEAGSGPIGPFTTLVFEVELLDIVA